MYPLHSKLRKNRLLPICVILGIFVAYIFIFHLAIVTNQDPIDSELNRRKRHLYEMCQKFPKEVHETTADKLYSYLNRTHNHTQNYELSHYQMEHMLIDDRHKVLFCYVPKVGCSNWKRIFMILTGISRAKDPLQIKSSYAHTTSFRTLNHLNGTERKRVLKEYQKFLFVRHPLERILSAYRNKFRGTDVSSQLFQDGYGRGIIKRFRNIAKPLSGSDVTFEEFIRYLLEPETSLLFNDRQSYQEHWEPITGICSPCTVNYDYVGIFENLVEESNFILKKFSKGIEYPESRRIQSAFTSAYMGSYYWKLPTELIKGLQKVFEMDFLLFNYTMDENLKNLQIN